MKKRVITVCDECGGTVLKEKELIQVRKYGYQPFVIGGVYTNIIRDFCSAECALKQIKKDWSKEE